VGSSEQVFLATARKYRPKTFQELIGQNHIAQTLLNALQSGRIPHALLFTGPRGTGKTSTARILAKALRCPNAKDFVPCQKCKECDDIGQGRSIDVIEIDGASNNGVDSVRELRESVGYAPSSGTYKVYIIDEVHMLSTSAFNALLKTLEEPPPHVVFVLATTEVQKIPQTIMSRCQRYDFRIISEKESSQHLASICKAEGVKFQDEAVWLIARQAKGSMRDSQSILDQIITFSDKNITVKKVTESLGLIQREIINRALKAIFERDIQALTEVIAAFNTSGSDPSLLVEDLLEQLRNALMVKIKAHTMNVPIDLPDSEMRLLEELTSAVTQEDIHFLFDITLKGSQHLSRATEPRLALEMLLLKLASAPQIQNLSRLLEMSTLETAVATAAPAAPTPSAWQSLTKNTAKGGASLTQPAAPAPTPTPAPINGDLTASAKAAETASQTKDPWQRFVETVRGSNGMLAALLEHTFVIEQSAENLKLGMPEKMAFLLDKLKDPKNMQRLQAFVENYWKQKPHIEVSLAKASPAKTEAPMTPKEKNKKAEADTRAQERVQVENHPMVKKAQSLFKTEIVAIKEEKRS